MGRFDHSSEKRTDFSWKEPSDWKRFWVELALAYFPVEAKNLQRLLPEGLRLQIFDQCAWAGLLLLKSEPLSLAKRFDCAFGESRHEAVFHTFVEGQGHPGFWPLSIQTNSHLACLAGRYKYYLPVRIAQIHNYINGDWTGLRSHSYARRKLCFSVQYKAGGDTVKAKPGSFAHWATERRCLFAVQGRNRIMRIELERSPLFLQSAEFRFEGQHPLKAIGLESLSDSCGCLYAQRLHCVGSCSAVRSSEALAFGDTARAIR